MLHTLLDNNMNHLFRIVGANTYYEKSYFEIVFEFSRVYFGAVLARHRAATATLGYQVTTVTVPPCINQMDKVTPLNCSINAKLKFLLKLN